MNTMTKQFKKVRDMIDSSEKKQLHDLRQQQEEEEEDDDDSSCSSSSSDSEFSDPDRNTMQEGRAPLAGDRDIADLNGRCEKQLTIKQDRKKKKKEEEQDSDSEEDNKESVRVASL